MNLAEQRDEANPNRLLIIDDDEGMRDFIADVADEAGYVILQTACADEFIAACKSFRPSLIFIDLVMPDTDGIELIRLLAKHAVKAKVCVMSGMDKKILQTAEHLGIQQGLKMFGILPKPVSVLDLDALFNQARKANTELTEGELATAIDKQQLVLHYQPKLCLKSDKKNLIDGVEALVRWQHPQRGLIYPDAFIGLAEQTGLIAGLTDTVMSQAISQMKQWHSEGLELSMAVNISPHNLTDLQMPDRFVSIMKAADVDPAYFTLEITETAAMNNVSLTADILTRLRLKNFALSLDDFGTGFSSLVQLYRLPFSELKIDRSFVAEVSHSEEARIIVKSLVDLAKNLGLSTCAEGVETESILAYCREIGCDKVQGYHISKPLPVSEFSSFIMAWRDKNSTVENLA
tara:strand:- start:13486 stop:14697 length:1212 start_codon:yes stop_codon:yes gene_type:complete